MYNIFHYLVLSGTCIIIYYDAFITLFAYAICIHSCVTITTASRPTMKELIIMRKRDDSTEKLRIIEWITAHKLTECDDFAHILLPALPVKKLRTKHGDNKEEFVRAVFQKWIDRDDDDKSDKSLPCTWAALVKCCEDAKLDRMFINLLRDYVFK